MYRVNLLLLAAAAVGAIFASSARAAVLASPTESIYTSTVKAQSEGHLVLTGPAGKEECSGAIEGNVKSHGVTVTATVALTSFSISGCTGGAKVTTIETGNLVFHTDGKTADGNGAVTSTGARFTVETSSGVSCGFETSETDFGTLTGSKTTGGTATLDIVAKAIPREFDSSACGTTWALSGSFKFSSPAYLDVDRSLLPGTLVTFPKGLVYTGALVGKSEGHLVFELATLGVKIECGSTIEGQIESHGSGVTAAGKFKKLTFEGCTGGGVEFTILKAGSFEIHTEAPGSVDNGRITWTGAEITLKTGLGFNCLYTTSGTDLGVLTGSQTTGGTATLDVNATLPRTGHSTFCGPNAPWGGSYTITTPDNLNID